MVVIGEGRPRLQGDGVLARQREEAVDECVERSPFAE
jgi:hypothetical protein